MPATLGTNADRYPLVLSIDPQGAGLKSVTLSDYYQTAARKQQYVFQQPLPGVENDTKALATRIVTIDGHDTDVSSTNWMQTAVTADSVTYTTTVNDAGGHPVLELNKTYRQVPRTAADGSQGFDISLHQGFRDLTEKPVKVSFIFNGPIPPGRENDRSEDRRYVSGHDAGDKWVDVASTSVSELKKDKPAQDLALVDPHPLLWVGACSSYFQAIFRPDYAGQTSAPPVKIASAIVGGLDAGPLVAATDLPTSLQITTSEFIVQPGQEAPFDGHVFFGPKKRQLLDADYYAKFPFSYDKTLVYTSGICSFITFNWLINVLYAVLAFFHLIFRDWGIAIICLVCVVRLLLHPITKKSQINMMQMGKMGPEIERLKKKFGDDKDGLNKAMMGVYKEQGLTPILGCLPMFLQTPIWIALWNALQSTFELRQAGFLRWQHLHLTWIADLSHPDALITLSQPLSLYFFTLHSINVLPLLVGGVSFAQQALMPAPTNMTPEQEQQRKMQRWMLLLFPIMLYVGPSGLNLYILTSSTIGMIESKIIRDHIKARDEAEKSGKIIIDAPATRNSKRKKDDKEPDKKPGKLGGWLADMQAKVEQIRREAQRRQ